MSKLGTQFINLTPFGHPVSCLEMKQHFHLRTRSQLTVGSRVPQCHVCVVHQMLGGYPFPSEILEVQCHQLKKSQETGDGGELKMSIAKSASWDFTTSC